MTSDPIEITLSNIRPDRQLHYENYQVVSVVQALWGAITQNMVAISLNCAGADVHLYFYLEDESPFDRKLVGEISEGLEALQFTSVSISTHITITGATLQTSQINGRLVYRRHEPQASA